MPNEYLKPLIVSNNSKIILLVMDGLGGLPGEPGGKTELEAARTPNMDRLAAEGTLGRTIPIGAGITPGSGPAHLALFGYDPLAYDIGRGALSASGIGMDFKKGDIAARGNFCTLDLEGKITDRRAGRIASEDSFPLVERLNSIQIPGVTIEVRQEKEYRFVIVMHGEDLSPDLTDTDPQQTGVPPFPVHANSPQAERTAALFNQWLTEARTALSDQPKANAVTLRGFATYPGLAGYQEAYGLKAACVAVYPMYRGVSKLVGMDVIDFEGEYPQDEFNTVRRIWDQYDFFFIHIKKTDSMGEDGNFAGKLQVIESVDQALPILEGLNPDVLIITGDHSTPSSMRTHSWHPVPFLLWANKNLLPDDQVVFGERACGRGGLGIFPALDTMPLALAHAGRLIKYGA